MLNQTALKGERVLERKPEVNEAIVICISVTKILIRTLSILNPSYNLQSTLTVHSERFSLYLILYHGTSRFQWVTCVQPLYPQAKSGSREGVTVEIQVQQ